MAARTAAAAERLGSPSLPRRRPRGDEGQVATAVMIVVTVGLVAVTGLGVLRLGAAVDERGQAQTAADAAALGGAEAARSGLVGVFAALRSVEDLTAVGDALTCGVGREGAVELAAANGADVTSYCYDSVTDRVEVEVVNEATGDAGTGPATARAVAALGLLIDDCEPSTDDPDADEVALTCGDLTVEFEVADGELRLATPPDELAERLADAFEPRLVE